jgi:antitoxin ParD1/3/4
MKTMNIALPADMKTFVSAEVKSRGYGSASEFVRALIREYREKRETSRLDPLLLAAIQSDMSSLSKRDFVVLREQLARRVNAKT